MNIQKKYTLTIDPEKADIYTSDSNLLYYKKDANTNTYYWYINGKNTHISLNMIPPRDSMIDINDLRGTTWNEKFNILEQRLNDTNKELTAWDIYRIKDEITDTDDVELKFSQLGFGETLIYNSKHPYKYTYNNTTYSLSSGDLIIKNLDGNAIIVEALSKGIYYPSKITRNKDTNQYSIEYSFTEKVPLRGEITKDIGQTVTDPYESIIFNSLQDSATRQPYNTRLSIPANTGRVTFPILYYQENNTTQPIYPVIKIYNNREEVYADFTLTTQGTNWVFETKVCDLNPNEQYYIVIK